MTTSLPSRAFEVTHRRVLAIAAPMTLAHLTTPLLGVVGTAVIGQLGEAHLLGAVAISAVVFDGIFWLFAFLRMGTVGLTAQALGGGDAIEQRAVLARAMVMATILGLAIIVLQQPIGWAAYRLMGASADVTEAAKVYFFVRIWSAPFTFANYAILGWLIGMARMRWALTLQVGINAVNMAATTVFVLVLDMGVSGAALGAVIAEAVGLFGGGVIVWQLMRGEARLSTAVVFDLTKLMRMIVINRDIMIRTAALITVFGLFTAQSARSGDTILAANAVLNNLVMISAYFLDGFATSAEQICGRALGARDRRAVADGVRLSIGWGLGLSLAVAVVLLMGGDTLIALMTTSPDVRVEAHKFLIFAAAAPLAGVLAYAFDGVYVGATWTRDLRNLMVITLVLYFAVWAALTPFGNTGLWVSFIIFLGARGLLQLARYPFLLRNTFGTPGDGKVTEAMAISAAAAAKGAPLP
jgi:MATE family multidrug resistance protein